MYCVDYSDKSVALFGNTALVQDHLKIKYGAKFNPRLFDANTGATSPGWIISKKHSAVMLKELNITIMPTQQHTARVPDEFVGLSPLKSATAGVVSTQPRPSASSSSSSSSSPVASARAVHGNATSDKKQEVAERAHEDIATSRAGGGGASTSLSASPAAAAAPAALPPMYVVNYSEKACAVFGQTKPVKQALSDLGGKWNKNLKDRMSSSGSSSDGGWIFSKKRREAIMDALHIPLLGGEGPGAASPAPAPAPASASSSSSSEAAPLVSNKKTAAAQDAAVLAELDRLRRGIEDDLQNTREEHRVAVPSLSQDKDKDSGQGRTETAPTPSSSSSSSSSICSSSSRDTVVAGTGARAGLYAVQYSDKCLAVFGNTKAVKETLKADFAGRFNGALNDPVTGAKAAGWIVLSKFRDDLNKWLLGVADGATAATAKAAVAVAVDANAKKRSAAASSDDAARQAAESGSAAKRKRARYIDEDDNDDDDDDDEPLVRR